jgi:hypothetical protein
MTWKLKRTKQCAKCPWRKDVDPHDIPDGYCETKHAALESTIAKDPMSSLADVQSGEPLKVMACHETEDAHCIGWLANQLGPGNNIGLRLSMRNCENADRIKLIGEQHDTFEETLPDEASDDSPPDLMGLFGLFKDSPTNIGQDEKETLDVCRQQFESWISNDPYCESIERVPDDPARFAWHGSYRSLKTDLAWQAWKAAWER